MNSRRETFRCEFVKCGKRCSGCPHGPYWYAYWREGPKVRKRYVGKGRPREDTNEANGPSQEPGPKARPHPHDAIFDDRQATTGLAWEIMGLERGDLGSLATRYRHLCREMHPDRTPGADPILFQRVQAAYAFLARWYS